MADSLAQLMTDDHRRCDRLLALIERVAGSGDWAAAATEAEAFRNAMERHFAVEEESLFPTLEEAAPMAAGPTGVMRMEHRQIRLMLSELTAAVETRDASECLGLIETLHLAAQQHNAKEEAILYPMADQVLGPSGVDLAKGIEG